MEIQPEVICPDDTGVQDRHSLGRRQATRIIFSFLQRQPYFKKITKKKNLNSGRNCALADGVLPFNETQKYYFWQQTGELLLRGVELLEVCLGNQLGHTPAHKSTGCVSGKIKVLWRREMEKGIVGKIKMTGDYAVKTQPLLWKVVAATLEIQTHTHALVIRTQIQSSVYVFNRWSVARRWSSEGVGDICVFISIFNFIFHEFKYLQIRAVEV